MNARARDLNRLLSAIAVKAEARLIAIETTGSGHKKALLARGDCTVALICPSTPSDRRSMLNTQADVRRLLTSM
jgi:hypothetical protein